MGKQTDFAFSCLSPSLSFSLVHELVASEECKSQTHSRLCSVAILRMISKASYVNVGRERDEKEEEAFIILCFRGISGWKRNVNA